MGKLKVISTSSAPFRDRREAGKLLAAELERFAGQGAVVLGIPRGGVAVAAELARPLQAEVDIVLAHKLSAPGHAELAMGAVAEDGRVFLNQEVVRELRAGSSYIESEKRRQLAELERRSRLFRTARPKVPLRGRTVIVTDDGVATGATAQAALWAARLEDPQELIVALPVGPASTLYRLTEDADEVVCLRVPPHFVAVGQFYREFRAVEDDEVLEILRASLPTPRPDATR